MKPLKVFKVLAIITLAVVLMPLVIPTLSPFSVGGQVSYNPPPGDIFHAPISGMGLYRIVMLQDNVSAMIGGSATSSSVSNPSGPQARGNGLQSINQRALRFINDTSYFPQSETTIAVDPSNPQHVVGGFNDAKFLFCQVFSADCTPSGSPASLSGFTVSIDGGLSVLKGSDIPDFNITAISFPPTVFPMIAFGDPTIVPSGDGNFLYSSLATSRDGGNGIMIAKSNSNLFDPNVSCVTSNIAPTVNACWKEIFVYGRTSIFSPTLEDKPVMAVDHGKGVYSGSVYVGWDHFTFGRATSSSYLARCEGDLNSCTMLSGGQVVVLSDTDLFTAFTTPVVDGNGNVYVTWCDYGTFTSFGPVACKVRSSPPGGTSFVPQTRSLVSWDKQPPFLTTLLHWDSPRSSSELQAYHGWQLTRAPPHQPATCISQSRCALQACIWALPSLEQTIQAIAASPRYFSPHRPIGERLGHPRSFFQSQRSMHNRTSPWTQQRGTYSWSTTPPSSTLSIIESTLSRPNLQTVAQASINRG